MTHGRDRWTTIASPAPNRLSFRRLRLEVLSGPDASASVDFATEPVRVGGLRDNDLPLTDPRVSALHAEIAALPDGVRLRDPGSTNGTYVDGVRVADAYLRDGARLRMGDSLLQLRALEDAAELALPPGQRFGELVGGTPAMRELYGRIDRIAGSRAPVLILGETGCGKEVAARTLHDAGPNPAEPFVALSCPAMPSELIEAELFGYERGAFTGAERAVAGAFERAGHGTVLLDEIGDMPLSLQPKLLGVLERRRVRRIGSSVDRPVHARVVAATNRDLPALVTRGAFRADLYYRLSVGQLRLPPLRERRDDIPLLVEHFARALPSMPTIDKATLARLREHAWPGNVRELRNAVERIALLGNPALAEHCIDPDYGSPEAPRLRVRLELPYADARDELLEVFRRVYARHVLARENGNVAAAARRAGVDRMTMYRILNSDREAAK